jgi:hypothetical protein
MSPGFMSAKDYSEGRLNVWTYHRTTTLLAFKKNCDIAEQKVDSKISLVLASRVHST